MLAAGAVLSLFETELFLGCYKGPPKPPCSEIHEPLNHRLLLEPEW